MMLVYWLLDVNVNLGVASKQFCHLVIDQCNLIPCLAFTLSGGQIRISGAINFQLDTEPNTDRPVFTLTCTSTGGPATTVSWTRDSNAVTANDDQIIITSWVTDAVGAIYVHTLRVTGRQEGSYSCSVSNSRTSPAAISTLQIAGKEPGISNESSCIVPSGAALSMYPIFKYHMIPFEKLDQLKVI